MLNHLNDPDRRRMPVAEWPSADRQAWERATSALGLRAGAAYRWRPDAQKKVAKAWGGLLTFLERSGDLDRTAAPETRATPQRVEAWVRALQARGTGDITIAGLVLDAGEAMRVMVPRFDGSWLYELHHRLATDAIPVRDKRQRIRHPWEVLNCATKVMHNAPNREYREQDHWLAEYRDGALLSLVATRPLRRRTLWQLRYGMSCAAMRLAIFST